MREGDDEARKREILPPKEKWPPAIRLAIQGKIKVLEDIPLEGHTVKVIDPNGKGKGKKKEHASVPNNAPVERKGEAHSFMEQLTPLLDKWFSKKAMSFGLMSKNSKDKKDREESKRQDGKTKGGKDQPALLQPVIPKKATARPKEGGKFGTQTPNLELWSTVVGRKAVKKPTVTPATKQVGGQQKGKPPGNSNGEVKRVKTTLPKKRPRTAAVMLSCPPGQFSEAMRVARECVKIEDLGIREMRPKRAATGAMLLEIPGPDGAEKASVLKDRMAEALREMEGIKVTRPVKMAELRVKDILESTDVNEVRGIISTLGECTAEEVKVGTMRESSNGLGTLWVQCPLKAANKVAALEKIKIGWTSSRVEILAPRKLQCYRCLERGHVQNNCKNDRDRSGLCYRCGQRGHLARQCENEPSCVVCRENNLPHDHRLGGMSCKAPTTRKVVGRNRDKVRKSGSEGCTPMETEPSQPSRPAVRGGSPREGATPVPVWPGTSGRDENMEVEEAPATSQSQPPLEKRTPRKVKGAEDPDKPSHSPR